MLEEQLSSLIIEKYGSIRNFSKYVNIPNSTIDSILKRGVENYGVKKRIKIFNALNLAFDDSVKQNKLVYSISVDDNKNNEIKEENKINYNDELTILFLKTKDHLNSTEYDIIKTILEKRHQEIDKQLNKGE